MAEWNYRVIRHTHEDEEPWLGIHEVFYIDGKPSLVTVDAVDVGGENIEELAQALTWMWDALDRPILDYADFEKGGKYYYAEG